MKTRQRILRGGVILGFVATALILVTTSAAFASGNESRSRPSQTYTWAEIALHNTPDDAWIVVNTTVYDISGFTRHHDGGNVFDLGADNTRVYRRGHGNNTRRIDRFAIGTLAQEQ